MTQNKITLNTLLNFIRENEKESKIFNGINTTVLNKYLQDTKSTWSKGRFFLGGQVALGIDDEFTLDLIHKVKGKNQKIILSNDFYNGFELMSINGKITDLNDMENIILKFMEINNDLFFLEI